MAVPIQADAPYEFVSNDGFLFTINSEWLHNSTDQERRDMAKCMARLRVPFEKQSDLVQEIYDWMRYQ